MPSGTRERFNTEGLGAWYSGTEIETEIAETVSITTPPAGPIERSTPAGSAIATTVIAGVASTSGAVPMRIYLGKPMVARDSITVEIVRKQPRQVGFAVQPRRSVIERSVVGLGRN